MHITSASGEQGGVPRSAPPLYNPPNAPAGEAIASRHHDYPVSGIASYATASRRLPRHKGNGAERLARGLGWFSIGLGLAQLLAPRTLARAAGVNDHPVLVRAVGMREIASGAGILRQPRQGGWLWSRVAGDVMDLALLGIAAKTAGKSPARRRRITVAAAAVAGIAMIDLMSSLRESRQARQAGMAFGPVPMAGEVDVEKSITVNRPADECYRFWRDFQNFPRFMQHLEAVEPLSDTRSHWRAKAPAGTSVAWDAEITVDHPGELLAWHSLEGADIDNAGTVRFERAPGGRGTVVRVDLLYKPPGGKAGMLIAKLFGEEPALQIDQDLRRFKQLIETGAITTTTGQSSGPRSIITRLLARQGEAG